VEDRRDAKDVIWGVTGEGGGFVLRRVVISFVTLNESFPRLLFRAVLLWFLRG